MDKHRHTLSCSHVTDCLHMFRSNFTSICNTMNNNNSNSVLGANCITTNTSTDKQPINLYNGAFICSHLTFFHVVFYLASRSAFFKFRSPAENSSTNDMCHHFQVEWYDAQRDMQRSHWWVILPHRRSVLCQRASVHTWLISVPLLTTFSWIFRCYCSRVSWSFQRVRCFLG